MLRGFSMLAVLASVAIAFGYVVTKGALVDDKPTHNLTPYIGRQITIVTYPKVSDEAVLIQFEQKDKRSMAIGRSGWRPGKRSTPNDRIFLLPDDGQPEQVPAEHKKRSLAIGRSQWRPGKRSESGEENEEQDSE